MNILPLKYKLPLYFVSLLLLLFPKIALAENIAAVYTDFNLITSTDFISTKTLADNLGHDYIIVHKPSEIYYYWVYEYVGNTPITYFEVRRSSTNLQVVVPAGYTSYFYDPSVNNLVHGSGSSSNIIIPLKSNWNTQTTQFLYSSLDVYNNSNYYIDITDNSTSITCDKYAYCNDFPMYSFYEAYVDPTPPTPPDNTPLLTSFVDVVIDKLTLTCEFITSSYVYLSIFVVFILTFVILLMRRLK